MSTPVMVESTAVDQWIYGRLTGDAELMTLVGNRIRAEQAASGDALPVVVYAALSPGVDVLARTTRVMTEMVYQVKAIGRTSSYVPLAAIMARIDAVLHQRSGTAAGFVVVGCWREGIIRYPEIDSGVEYRHLGGRYRLQVHRA